MLDTDDGQGAAGDFHGRGGVEFAKDESVMQGLGFFGGDQEADFHFVLEPEGGFEIAFGMDARPAHPMGMGPRPTRRRVGRVENGGSQRAEKGVLGAFHETKEIGIVHQARHVGVGEFDAAGHFEFVRHETILDTRFRIDELKTPRPRPRKGRRTPRPWSGR